MHYIYRSHICRLKHGVQEGSRLWVGQKAIYRPSHHLTATRNSIGSRCRPRDVDGITDNQDVAWGGGGGGGGELKLIAD